MNSKKGATDIDRNDIKLYSNLMAESFLEDPGVKMQLEGVSNKLAVFETQCRCQIEAFLNMDGFTTIGHGDGMTLGYFTEDEERLSSFLQQTSSYLIEHITISDRMAIQQKAIELFSELIQPDWYKPFLGEREVYVLQAIVVRPSLRGTGVFRRLISPILESAAQRGTPVVLQTHVFDHIAKYEHVGFKLMEQVVSDKLNIACYNLLLDNGCAFSQR